MGVNNKKNINEKINNFYDRYKKLLKSLRRNYLFTICLIIKIIALSILYPSNAEVSIIGNITQGIITFIISIIIGYYVHVYSHIIDYEEIYKNIYNSSNILGKIIRKLPKPIKWIINKYVYLLDFHDKVHHNTKINKEWQNVLIEVLMNICTQGVMLIIILKMLNFGIQIRGYLIKFNYAILFAWSILYTTIHNINYNIIKSKFHIQHHINENTNYGIDLMDIIIGSKYDDEYEKLNHASLNIIITLLSIILIKEYYNPEKANILYKIVNWFISY